MKRKLEIKRSSQRTALLFVLVAIIAIGLVGCEGGLFAEPTATPLPPTETPIPPTETPVPTATKTERPTMTPKPTATEILETATPDYRSECIPYTMVTKELAGETICVYGEIVKWTSGGGYAAVIRFEDVPDAFLVRSVRYYWGSIEVGDCIMIFGELHWNGAYAYLEMDKDGEGLEIGYSDQCH
ncbi:MAG: hypothetical protein ABFS17_12720 [Chloroflexota bacterium]